MKTGSSTYSRTKRNPIISKDYKICGNVFKGLSFKLGAKNLVLLKAKQGFIACGYLNIKTCEKLDDTAAIVKGVSSVDDLLRAKIVAVSKAAKRAGVYPGMLGKSAILKLN